MESINSQEIINLMQGLSPELQYQAIMTLKNIKRGYEAGLKETKEKPPDKTA